MQDDSGSSDGLRMLRRISEVLDRPISDFYRSDEANAGAAVPSSAECAQLLDAFARISDPETRRRILALMRSFAGT